MRVCQKSPPDVIETIDSSLVIFTRPACVRVFVTYVPVYFLMFVCVFVLVCVRAHVCACVLVTYVRVFVSYARMCL